MLTRRALATAAVAAAGAALAWRWWRSVRAEARGTGSPGPSVDSRTDDRDEEKSTTTTTTTTTTKEKKREASEEGSRRTREERWLVRSLFGGAFSLSLPESFEDISQFRHVPDNQEVLADADTDRSCIVDILELDDSALDAVAARVHLAELSRFQDGENLEVEKTVVLDAEAMAALGTELGAKISYASMIVGQHDVAKYRDEVADRVRLVLVLLRVREFTADILVSFNLPVRRGEESRFAKERPEQAALERSTPLDVRLREQEEFVWLVLRSFRVRSWYIFTREDPPPESPSVVDDH